MNHYRATMLGARERHLVSRLSIPDAAGTPLWSLSQVDGRGHAINPDAEHPVLMYLAWYGHRVLRRITLCEVPQGYCCPSCVRWADR